MHGELDNHMTDERFDPKPKPRITVKVRGWIEREVEVEQPYSNVLGRLLEPGDKLFASFLNEEDYAKANAALTEAATEDGFRIEAVR